MTLLKRLKNWKTKMTQINNEREEYENFEAWLCTLNSLSPSELRFGFLAWQAAKQSPISQNEQQEAVAYADASLVCTISTYMIKELESRNETNKFPYHLWPTKLYTSPPKQIPDGWKLVPIEPDFNMKQAALEWNRKNTSGTFIKVAMEYHVAEQVYKAMINAAPTNTEVGE